MITARAQSTDDGIRATPTAAVLDCLCIPRDSGDVFRFHAYRAEHILQHTAQPDQQLLATRGAWVSAIVHRSHRCDTLMVALTSRESSHPSVRTNMSPMLSYCCSCIRPTLSHQRCEQYQLCKRVVQHTRAVLPTRADGGPHQGSEVLLLLPLGTHPTERLGQREHTLQLAQEHSL